MSLIKGRRFWFAANHDFGVDPSGLSRGFYECTLQADCNVIIFFKLFKKQTFLARIQLRLVSRRLPMLKMGELALMRVKRLSPSMKRSCYFPPVKHSAKILVGVTGLDRFEESWLIRAQWIAAHNHALKVSIWPECHTAPPQEAMMELLHCIVVKFPKPPSQVFKKPTVKMVQQFQMVKCIFVQTISISLK